MHVDDNTHEPLEVRLDHFMYFPLDAAKQQIRVFRLYQSPRFDDPIICQAHNPQALEDSPIYSALSYTWGDQEKSCEILCDGYPFRITSNLDLALRRLRQRNVRDIWADAMCIDQASISEKSTQVMLMQKIYEKAENVYIDLGEDKQNCFDLALKAFLTLKEMRPSTIR